MHPWVLFSKILFHSATIFERFLSFYPTENVSRSISHTDDDATVCFLYRFAFLIYGLFKLGKLYHQVGLIENINLLDFPRKIVEFWTLNPMPCIIFLYHLSFFRNCKLISNKFKIRDEVECKKVLHGMFLADVSALQKLKLQL